MKIKSAMSAFHIHHSSIEISPSAPGHQPPLRARFLAPGDELEQALALILKHKDSSTPLEQRRRLRGARGIRVEVERPDGERDAYFVRAVNGVAAPLMRDLESVPFGLTPATQRATGLDSAQRTSALLDRDDGVLESRHVGNWTSTSTIRP